MSAYSADPKAEHLLRLSNEVGRIAGTLARLSAESEDSAEGEDASNDDAPIDPELVMTIIRGRRMRGHFLDESLFADPAWDMMLELFHSELLHRRTAISSLCAAAAVPATTALRWLTNLVEKGVCIRRDDPLDGRRVYVELTREASKAMRMYMTKLGDTPVI
jgi:hypothetical protein